MKTILDCFSSFQWTLFQKKKKKKRKKRSPRHQTRMASKVMLHRLSLHFWVFALFLFCCCCCCGVASLFTILLVPSVVAFPYRKTMLDSSELPSLLRLTRCSQCCPQIRSHFIFDFFYFWTKFIVMNFPRGESRFSLSFFLAWHLKITACLVFLFRRRNSRSF